MADNVAITGSGSASAATDEVTHSGDTGQHVQVVRPAFVTGSEGSKTIVDWGNKGDTARVTAHRHLTRVAVASGGLTTSVTSYTAGDQMGTMFTLTGMARANGGSGTITGVLLISAADNIGAVDVMLFRTNATLSSDNVAFSISDTDALQIVGLVQLVGSWDIGANRIAQQFNLAVPYVCDSGTTSLYAALITRAAHTFFGAATDLQLVVLTELND